MSLPACQERILSGIENALRACEPRLASRFAIFTRLTRDEEIPGTEQLVPQTWLRRALTNAGRAFRFLFPRPLPRGRTAVRAQGRPAARLRSAVVLPVLLIAMASATVATAIAGRQTCASAPRRPPATETRWATCAANRTVVQQGAHGTGTSPVTGHQSPDRDHP
ncbi:MAG TPA: hypothetical protein VGF54_12910 [Streptosporangiaceae bacterium]|jgi:hypothetical protein